MRCHKVTAVDAEGFILATRLAATTADAKQVRDELVERFDVHKRDVNIEKHEVPADKPGLLAYLNELLAETDYAEEAEDEEAGAGNSEAE